MVIIILFEDGNIRAPPMIKSPTDTSIILVSKGARKSNNYNNVLLKLAILINSRYPGT